MNINEVFPSKYLTAEEIGEAKPVLTIEKVEFVTFKQDGKEEQKPVLWFVGKTKALTCNKTNCKTIAKVTGCDDTDDWVGKKIRLLATEVDYRGEMKLAIRVSSQPVSQSASVPTQRAPSPAPSTSNDMASEDINF